MSKSTDYTLFYIRRWVGKHRALFLLKLFGTDIKNILKYIVVRLIYSSHRSGSTKMLDDIIFLITCKS